MKAVKMSGFNSENDAVPEFATISKENNPSLDRHSIMNGISTDYGENSTGLQSEERCVENDDESEDDFDLPKPWSPQPVCHKKKFDRDDIVWMKIKKLYVPGVVISSRKKSRLARVNIINRQLQQPSLRKRFRDLLDFNDSSRNKQLLEEGRKHDPKIQEAYEEIEDFWFRNYKKGGTLSAAKYFSSKNDDNFYDTSKILEILQKTKENEVMEKENPVGSEENAYGSTTSDTPELHVASSPSPNRTDEGNPELSLEMDEEANKLLKIIKNQDCKTHLQNILYGIGKSWRHSVFMSGNRAKQENLVCSAGLGPFSNKMGVVMASCLEEHLNDIDESDTISKYGKRHTYLFNVLMPEAIVYAISKAHNLNLEKAEERFTQMSSKIF